MSDDTGSSPPRRHWKGEPGSRHEHQNVWMNGGIRSTAPSAPWSGWDADKKRRESTASTTSDDSQRSGFSGRPLFDKLNAQKRGSVTVDPKHAEKRKSYAEMQPEKGFFGKLWHGYVAGTK